MVPVTVAVPASLAQEASQSPVSQTSPRKTLQLAQFSFWDTIRFVPPPSYQAAPSTGRSRGGASRGNCNATDAPLTALVPTATQNHETGGNETLESETTVIPGLTTAPHPTFWFYTPTPLTPDQPAEFLLLDEAGEYVYTTTLNYTETPGIIKVVLPTSLPNLENGLEEGKTYRWVFQVTCESGNPIDIWGEVQRVAVSQELQTQLEQASTEEQVALYAANGIWYEALTTLANLHFAEPNNPMITAGWSNLLQSANLEDIADHPLIACCEAEQNEN